MSSEREDRQQKPSKPSKSAEEDSLSEEPVSYDEFRTGLSYGEVYYLIWSRPYKRRHGVLGKWRELKKQMYEEYIRAWREEKGLGRWE